MFFKPNFSKKEVKRFRDTYGEKIYESYFDLVEEFENCIWFLYAQKKGLFFVRALNFVILFTFLFLFLCKFWFGFVYLIFLQWFWIFQIYINEIDFILNEDSNDNADFEYEDFNSDTDNLLTISPKIQLFWIKSGLIMNKRFSIKNYMDSKLLRYSNKLQFIFTFKYSFVFFNLNYLNKIIYNKFKPIKNFYNNYEFKDFDLNLFLNNNLKYNIKLNNDLKNNIKMNLTKYLNFQPYIHFYFFYNNFIEDLYYCYKNIKILLIFYKYINKNKNFYFYFYLSSKIVNFSFIEYNSFIKKINK